VSVSLALAGEQTGRWSFYRVVDGALDSLAGALATSLQRVHRHLSQVVLT